VLISLNLTLILWAWQEAMALIKVVCIVPSPPDEDSSGVHDLRLPRPLSQ